MTIPELWIQCYHTNSRDVTVCPSERGSKMTPLPKTTTAIQPARMRNYLANLMHKTLSYSDGKAWIGKSKRCLKSMPEVSFINTHTTPASVGRSHLSQQHPFPSSRMFPHDPCWWGVVARFGILRLLYQQKAWPEMKKCFKHHSSHKMHTIWLYFKTWNVPWTELYHFGCDHASHCKKLLKNGDNLLLLNLVLPC